MDWSQIITELGGGPMAVGTAALGFLYWKERLRSNELVERLIQKSAEGLAESIRRETETLQMLKEIAASARGKD